MPEHDDDAATGGAAGLEARAHERGTNPTPLMLGENGERRETTSGAVRGDAVDVDRREQNVTRDQIVDNRNERQRPWRCAQRIDDVGLARSSECAFVDHPDLIRVTICLGSNRERHRRNS